MTNSKYNFDERQSIGVRTIPRMPGIEELRKDFEEYQKELRLGKIKSKGRKVTSDDNPPQVSLTSGWLYVPSIGMEFASDLEGLGSNWYDSHKFASSKNCIMPSPAETWELFFYSKDNLAKPEFRKVYEYFTQKTPADTWHSEWQNAFFKEENGKMLMSRLKGFNARGEPEFDKGVDITGTYLDSDGYADISQRGNITSSGLCKIANSRGSYKEGENIYFYYPRDDSVAWFNANSIRASFNCYGGATFTISSLGVRLARRVAPSVCAKNGGSK